MRINKNKSSLVFSVLFSVASANATLTPHLERGTQNVYFQSPNGVEEVCVIPAHYPDAKYKKKDLEKEQELCHYSFYPLSAEQQSFNFKTVALAPKLNSTNPGVNIFKIPATSTKAAVEKAMGEVDGASKIGKYKNSTSCSYTPSILGYYHISRILGGIGRVPPSVLRTMDIETHKSIAQQGKAKTKEGDLINTTWSSLLASLNSGLASQKKDLLMTDDGKQSYGAFIVNPKNEESYSTLFNSGPNRAAAFRDKNAVFSVLKNRSAINNLVTSEWTAANLQKLFALKDVSEFILADYLLDQQDRFGNIAYQDKLVYVAKDHAADADYDLQIGDQDDYDKDLAKGLVQLDKKPLTIKMMVLKDNDCGVSKTNVVKAEGLLQQVAHMNSKTYKRLMELQQTAAQNEQFFTRNLMFTKTDYQEFIVNLNSAAQILKTNCEQGNLKLDLDIDDYMVDGILSTKSCGN